MCISTGHRGWCFLQSCAYPKPELKKYTHATDWAAGGVSIGTCVSYCILPNSTFFEVISLSSTITCIHVFMLGADTLVATNHVT